MCMCESCRGSGRECLCDHEGGRSRHYIHGRRPTYLRPLSSLVVFLVFLAVFVLVTMLLCFLVLLAVFRLPW